MRSSALTPEDIAWVKSYADEVGRAFAAEFTAASDRFKQGQVLLDRFKAAIEAVLKNGRGHFRPVDETHNELCVASALLANTRLRFVRLEYEPPLLGCAKTIDFKATAGDGQMAYVDVTNAVTRAVQPASAVPGSNPFTTGGGGDPFKSGGGNPFKK